MKCDRCQEGREVKYRVFTENMDIKVCAACAAEPGGCILESRSSNLKKEEMSKASNTCGGRAEGLQIQRKSAPNSFSLLPLLIVSEDISLETREALREHRLQDAATRLMEEYGLSCVEAGDLLGVAVCKDK